MLRLRLPLGPVTLRLHPDAIALGALPLSLLVVNVSLQFLHLDSALFAGHYFEDRIPCPGPRPIDNG